MPAADPLSPAERARHKLRARAERIARLRRRVAAIALTTFAVAFGAIAYDGSMGTTTSSSTSAHAAATATTTTSSAGSGSSDTDATATGDSSSGDSTSDGTTTSESSDSSSVTTHQS